MSPRLPFTHIYHLPHFLCSQTSQRWKKCPELLSKKPPRAEGGAGWFGHEVNYEQPREKHLLSSFVLLMSHFTTPFHSLDNDAFPQQKGQKFTFLKI